MSKYTSISNKASDIIIQHDLELIVQRLLDTAGEYIKAILLTGGFGRGEGAVVKEGANYRPINDYDILVVVKRWKSIPNAIKVALDKIDVKLNSRISVKQVDLGFIDAWKLALPSSSIARYEVKKGFKLLYNKGTIRISCFPRKLLPLYEAIKYFRTRGGGLLIARLLLDNNYYSKNKNLELAYIEINKAFLAIGDSYLIQNRLYHFSYVVRKSVFLHNYRKLQIPNDIAKHYIVAIESKLLPDFKKLKFNEINAQWYFAAKKILEHFLRFESFRYGEKFRCIAEYKTYITQKRFYQNDIINKIFHQFNKENSRRIINLRLISMQLLEYKVTNKDKTWRCARHLNAMENDWKYLTKMFLLEWHPKGIISYLTQVQDVDA